MAMDLQHNLTNVRVEDVFVKPLFTATAGAALSKLLFDYKNLSVMGKNYNFTLAVAGGLYARSVLATVFNDFVFPHLQRDEHIRVPASAAVNLGASAVSSLLAFYGMNPKAP